MVMPKTACSVAAAGASCSPWGKGGGHAGPFYVRGGKVCVACCWHFNHMVLVVACSCCRGRHRQLCSTRVASAVKAATCRHAMRPCWQRVCGHMQCCLLLCLGWCTEVCAAVRLTPGACVPVCTTPHLLCAQCSIANVQFTRP
jgi:hypothetical protein